jgi:hypothetical protein
MRIIFLLIFPLLLWTCKKNDNDDHVSHSPEMVIFDSILTTTADDHGFFYFNPPNTPPNWKSPNDFYNGNFYYRFEIMDYPSEQIFLLSLCIWADIEGNWVRWKETCSDQLLISGKGIFTSYSVPSTWWNLNDPVDFSRVRDFDHMGMVVWCEDLKLLSDWSSESNSCWSQRDEILPLTLRLTVVAVAQGNTFRGWEYYIY